jgi:crotonobetainyl-CoA:carnitine CoA-transferase CaiB-like acyl-CoA transferase
MTGILKGIRVLDFGRYIAGPYCATILADFGAEVIRIEKVDGSEDRYVFPVAKDGDGAMFMQMARNKKGMTLNPMKPAGREIVKKLVATADVVIANLPPQALQEMGLDFESLKAVKVDIILTTPSAFGSKGPYSHKLGFDSVGQAMSGAMYMSGYPDQPMRSMASYVDFGTALYSAVGTLAAMMERNRSGMGQQVETSLLGTAIAFMNPFIIEQAILKPDRVASGNRGQTTAPADTFRTRDGWVLVSTIGQIHFERWTKLMEEDHWLTDPRFKDDISRGDNSVLVSERMAAWCSGRTNKEALAELEAAGIPAGPVLSLQQVLDDPHVRAAEYLKLLDYPEMPHAAPVSDIPVRLSTTPAGIRHRPPTLGEHTDGILCELGYTPAEIEELRRTRVV